MCGRYTVFDDAEIPELQTLLRHARSTGLPFATGEIFPSQSAMVVVQAEHAPLVTVSRTGVEPNCPTTMHFRIFRRAFTRKISILLRKITPKSIKNAFAGGCEQF